MIVLSTSAWGSESLALVDYLTASHIVFDVSALPTALCGQTTRPTDAAFRNMTEAFEKKLNASSSSSSSSSSPSSSLSLSPAAATLSNRLKLKLGISVIPIDVSHAAVNREEIWRRDPRSAFLHGEDALSCEFMRLPSDTAMLVINAVYSKVLELIIPVGFPLSAVHVTIDSNDTSDRAIQRVALNELAVVNYLYAARRIDHAITSNKWAVPNSNSSESGGAPAAAVTLTLTDVSYAEAIPYWYHSKRYLFAGVEGVMVAMDTATCKHLTELDAVRQQHYLFICMYSPPTLRAAPPHKMSTMVALGKALYPALFMNRYNVSVIFSEMDVFWRSNPLPFLTQV